ncbi:MAG: hypothetical protein IPM71_07145 [Bacteroidota bacterium]|nr:MAG: hypothetical protein IPM71_07145 [Bacteroidota bacterium]
MKCIFRNRNGLPHPEASIYQCINLLFFGLIALVFIYSAFFHYARGNYLFTSAHDLLTGEPSLSTGLSRSFSAIVRLEFEIAHFYNPYGIRVFLFFLEQFFLRIILWFILERNPERMSILVWCDGLVCSVLFLIHFWPFLLESLSMG